VKVFGIDPGSVRTGYGCVERRGSRCHLVTFGTIGLPARTPFPDRLLTIHAGLARLFDECRPDCVAVEGVFHAANARSALALGHARGVVLLAARQAGLPVLEYTPAEIKRAVVGYGRAEKVQVQRMVSLLLGMSELPSPHDAADALAVALCHVHLQTTMTAAGAVAEGRRQKTRWRDFRPAGEPAT
jgi:crossover junction endodeoxyribonuclease RuvC